MNKGTTDHSAAAALLGSLGGRARMIKMTSEERSMVARVAAEARWARARSAPQVKQKIRSDR